MAHGPTLFAGVESSIPSIVQSLRELSGEQIVAVAAQKDSFLSDDMTYDERKLSLYVLNSFTAKEIDELGQILQSRGHIFFANDVDGCLKSHVVSQLARLKVAKIHGITADMEARGVDELTTYERFKLLKTLIANLPNENDKA